jgi:hypothetical protein
MTMWPRYAFTAAVECPCFGDGNLHAEKTFLDGHRHEIELLRRNDGDVVS